MGDQGQPTGPRAWWQTLPGVLAALAGLVAAVGGLLVSLHQVGWLPERAGAPAPVPAAATADKSSTSSTTPAPPPSGGQSQGPGQGSGGQAPAGQTLGGLRITAINNKAPGPSVAVGAVGSPVVLEGTCPDPAMRIWILQRYNDHQYLALARGEVVSTGSAGCNWRAEVRPDANQLVAVGNPSVEIAAATIFSGPPPAEFASQIITIAR